MSAGRAMSSPRALIVSARFASLSSIRMILMLLQKLGCQDGSRRRGSHKEGLGRPHGPRAWTHPARAVMLSGGSSSRLLTQADNGDPQRVRPRLRVGQLPSTWRSPPSTHVSKMVPLPDRRAMPRLLYKYVTADRASTCLPEVGDGALRATQPAALNDPFECHVVKTFVERDVAEGNAEFREDPDETARTRTRNARRGWRSAARLRELVHAGASGPPVVAALRDRVVRG